MEPGQASIAPQEKFFHVALKNGDKISVVLGKDPIHLTDGWQDQEIPADSISRVRFNGGLHGYYEGEEGDEPLGFAFVKDSHLNMRLAKDHNLLRMPWTQIDSLRVDLGDFRPDIHKISWVKEEKRPLERERRVVVAEETPSMKAPCSAKSETTSQQGNIPSQNYVISDSEEMMYIPAGSYLVVAEGGQAKKGNEQQTAQVDIPAFYTDKRPVTNKQYAAFVVSTGHAVPSDWVDGRIPEGLENEPVVNVSYEDAADYAAWLVGVCQLNWSGSVQRRKLTPSLRKQKRIKMHYKTIKPFPCFPF